MVGNHHQHPQNHQPFQFYQDKELEAHSSHFPGRTGRTGPAHGTLRVRVTPPLLLQLLIYPGRMLIYSVETVDTSCF